MLTAAARPDSAPVLTKKNLDAPAFVITGRASLALQDDITIAGTLFAAGTAITLPAGEHRPGSDFGIFVDGNALIALPDTRDTNAAVPGPLENGLVQIGGFHFAPGGNAAARSGGDDIPAINPFSIWDLSFRPACPDPRGMFTIVLPDGSRSWIDIYKLGVDHLKDGTSRCGVTIADGESLPGHIGGNGKVARLDFPTAQEILGHHGKHLLTYDEFRGAAFGVTEKTAAGKDPKVTGLDAPRTSRFGMMQATGNLWDWGTDGDPDNPRASLFGGSWWDGGDAGSRFAGLGHWPDGSGRSISARGRCDHLPPA